MTFSKLTYLDFQIRPHSPNAETDRFFGQVQLVFKRMAGEFAEDDRVVTVKDLKDLGLIPK